MARFNEGSKFYLPPTHFAFTPQPQSITALWPVIISRPAEGRRLSCPGWVVTYRGVMPAQRWSTIPVLTGLHIE